MSRLACTLTTDGLDEAIDRARLAEALGYDTVLTAYTSAIDLTRIYAKLGVRSRTELAHRLHDDEVC